MTQQSKREALVRLENEAAKLEVGTYRDMHGWITVAKKIREAAALLSEPEGERIEGQKPTNEELAEWLDQIASPYPFCGLAAQRLREVGALLLMGHEHCPNCEYPLQGFKAERDRLREALEHIKTIHSGFSRFKKETLLELARDTAHTARQALKGVGGMSVKENAPKF